MDLISGHQPLILILLEAPTPDEVAKRIKDDFGFSNFTYVEPMIRRGGIWYVWKDPIQTIDFISTEPSLFHSLVTMAPNDPEVLLSAIHTPSSSSHRSRFWNSLAQDPPPSQHPWMVLGDLNTVTNETEKCGGLPLYYGATHYLLEATPSTRI